MSKNKSKNQAKVRPYAVMCTDLYLLWILAVYPLYYADGYFHLPEKKATFWCVSTLIYLGVTLFGVIITAFSDRELWTLENFKKNISMTDIFMFGFLVSNLIAFALSEDKVNAWTGASSRYYGAKVLILVCLVYFFVSRYAWVNKVFIWAFLIGGNGVCLLATLDYFWLDVLGINQQMIEADWYLFISTMGNANTCASFCCMAITVAIVYYCVSDNLKDKIIAGISIVNCSVTLVTARSDSASVGVAGVCVILVILMLNKTLKWRNVLQSFLILTVGLLAFTRVREYFAPSIQAHRWYDSGIPRAIWYYWTIWCITLFILVVLYLAMIAIEKKGLKIAKVEKWAFRIIGGIVVLVVIGFIGEKIHVIQLFKDSMGNGSIQVAGNRIYTYGRVAQAFGKVPFINKLFGNGQASLTSVLNTYFGDELLTLGISINSAHNHILDYLIIGGIFGVLCYLGLVINSFISGFKLVKKNVWTLLPLCVVLAYFTQGIFNIDQTITTVFFWLGIAIIEAMNRNNKLLKN